MRLYKRAAAEPTRKIPYAARKRLHEMSFTHSGANLSPPRMTDDPDPADHGSRIFVELSASGETRDPIHQALARMSIRIVNPQEFTREECCTIILLAYAKAVYQK